jgi:hypothetical protein
MGLNTSDYQEYAPGQTGSADFYGDADYDRDKASGMSDSEILAQINAEPGKMGDGGVGGNLYNRIASGANSGGSSSSGGGSGYAGGSVGAGPGGYAPGDVNFNPGGIDMGGSSPEPSWSNDDFIRGLAKERAEAFTDESTTSQNQSITNNIEQNVGNKGDITTTIGDNATISNSPFGNDYSLNMGSINVANNQNQLAL